MKLRAIILGFCVGFCSSVLAVNQHIHPQVGNGDNKSTEKNVGYPGYCEIEIINRSFDDVTVYGIFDDGVTMEPFNIYSFESPHYISLYYYNYCHAGMNLYIDTFSGYHVYSGYTYAKSTVRIVPYWANQLKAEIVNK